MDLNKNKQMNTYKDPAKTPSYFCQLLNRDASVNSL